MWRVFAVEGFQGHPPILSLMVRLGANKWYADTGDAGSGHGDNTRKNK